MHKFQFPAFTLVLVLLCWTSNAYSQSTKTKHFNTKRGNIAIKGYDPVSYFTEGKAVKGNAQITHNYGGIVYRFKNNQNRNIFRQNPAKYEPMYGGWCAYAFGLAKPSKVDINPRTFKIIGGRLYLFYNKLGTNTLKMWNKDERNLKSKADKNWQKIYK
ncbi:YHS domain-containing (seleno)protein [uncultured Microscilla sp.]|uniref:YHS domain-containing (seleno)protein n=1 Tax=uncultured Microscilla sp. TaxID=432653 RepID=UPI002612B795|nr:YHS domain-containing (seleno)protein [uncultured Microscilla sp.]